MKFECTGISGAYVIAPERIEDDRGFFSRTWCRREFAAHGLDTELVQCNISFNRCAGTVRGMHYQAAPSREAKLIRCTMGAIHDVIIDLRPESGTYMHAESFELSADNRMMLYVPEGVAHGFQTRTDNTEIFYQMSEYYNPEAACGLRWNDPSLNIEWPADVTVISERDRSYADFLPSHNVQVT